MERFACPTCSGPLFFSNLDCGCGAQVLWEPETRAFVPLETGHACANRAEVGCPWAAPGPGQLCPSCAMTRTRPDPSADNDALWAEAEGDKRWVIANLMRWGMFRAADAGPRPVFDFLSEVTRTGGEDVTMGHANGLITIDVLEADWATLERRRDALDESYRTMTGHLRHEIGHFIFERLATVPGFLDAFRPLFGDETADYGAALDRHYAEGPPPDWQARFVSSYASMHPHEDWAETFAHVLHLTDMLDTAQGMGLSTPGSAAAGPAYETPAGDEALVAAMDLAIALNQVNRSMGLHDIYPFVVSGQAREKFYFVRTWLERVAA